MVFKDIFAKFAHQFSTEMIEADNFESILIQ